MSRKNSIQDKQLENILEQKANKGYRLYASSHLGSKKRKYARRSKKGK